MFWRRHSYFFLSFFFFSLFVKSFVLFFVGPHFKPLSNVLHLPPFLNLILLYGVLFLFFPFLVGGYVFRGLACVHCVFVGHFPREKFLFSYLY